MNESGATRRKFLTQAGTLLAGSSISVALGANSKTYIDDGVLVHERKNIAGDRFTLTYGANDGNYVVSAEGEESKEGLDQVKFRLENGFEPERLKNIDENYEINASRLSE